MKKMLTSIICSAVLIFIAGCGDTPTGVSRELEDIIKMAETTHGLNPNSRLIPKNSSCHWKINGKGQVKAEGENWNFVDLTFYYVSPAIGESRLWNKIRKKVTLKKGRDIYSVRAFRQRIVYINRGSNYDIEYIHRDGRVVKRAVELFIPEYESWQYKTINIPKTGPVSRGSFLSFVIDGYRKKAGIKGVSQDYEITNVTKDEYNPLYPYKGTCKFRTVVDTIEKNKNNYSEKKRSFQEHNVKVYWSSIVEDWIEASSGSTSFTYKPPVDCEIQNTRLEKKRGLPYRKNR